MEVAEEMLSVLGYDPGKIDGYFDEATEKALKTFQEDEGIEITGILHGETTFALMNKLRQHIQENDPQVKKAVEVLTK